MRRHSFLTSAATVLLAVSSAAVAFGAAKATQPAAETPKDVFAHLKFRNLGPAIAGGRVAAVAGIPGNPLVYYVGAGGGAVS